MHTPKTTTDSDVTTPDLHALSNTKWVMDSAWITGLIGAVSIILCAKWYQVANYLNEGVAILGMQITTERVDSILFAIGCVTFIMLTSEFFRLRYFYKSIRLSVHPLIQSRQYKSFIVECGINYIAHIALLSLIMQFFFLANEYGFKNNNAYYQPWFRLLDIAFSVYLWCGLPYVLVTRGLKHSEDDDKRDYGIFFSGLITKSLKHLFSRDKADLLFSSNDKKNTLSLLVKLFFLPLMTVFLCDQFPHLVNNMGYLSGGFWANLVSDTYSHTAFNNDLFNISISFIFSIDVGLAWCGYLIASRWIENQTFSAEPTLLGWIVCIICYPPLQNNLGYYFNAPGERDIIGLFSNQTIVTVLMIFTIISFFIYMLATVFFGARFSNLTNRGIIRTGPFAIVRHPAYAAKNLAWWLVMFPAILYNASHAGWSLAITQILGLMLITWVYYMRAITEEKHLSQDPYYLAYCKQVEYRFIPKLF